MAIKKYRKSAATRARALGLKPREAAFVQAFVRYGKQVDAAREIGITPARASQLFTDPRVNAAILAELEWQMTADAAVGMRVLRELAEDADEDSVKLRAAESLVKRALGPPKEVHEHRHSHTHRVKRDAASMMERIGELQNELGLNGKVVDAEFREVESSQEAEAQPSGALVKKLPFPIA